MIKESTKILQIVNQRPQMLQKPTSGAVTAEFSNGTGEYRIGTSSSVRDLKKDLKKEIIGYEMMYALVVYHFNF